MRSHSLVVLAALAAAPFGAVPARAACQIAAFDPATSVFHLDANDNGLWDGVAGGDAASEVASFAGPGLPLVGDWNGDGDDDIALGVEDPGYQVYVDDNGNARWDGTGGGDRIVPGGYFAMIPGYDFATDWDLDGVDEVGRLEFYGSGLYRFSVEELGSVDLLRLLVNGGPPLVCDWDGDGSANLGRVAGEVFRLDANGNGTWDGNAGGDLEMGFVPPAGVGGPIAGRWAPPPP